MGYAITPGSAPVTSGAADAATGATGSTSSGSGAFAAFQILGAALVNQFNNETRRVLGKLQRPFGPAKSRTFSTAGTQEFQTIVYGEVPVPGHLIFYGTSGANNEFLWLVYVVACHQVEEIGDIWLGDLYIPSSCINPSTKAAELPALQDVGGYTLMVLKMLGEHDQAAPAELVAAFPEWTSEHRGAGVAMVGLRAYRSDRVWSNRSVDDFRCMVKGKRVYQRRLDSTNGGTGSHRMNDATTWTWSDNPIDCTADYLTGGSKYFSTATPNAILGLQIPATRFLEAAWRDQADICDEIVETRPGLTLIPVSRFMSLEQSGATSTLTGWGSGLAGLGLINPQEISDYAYSPLAREAFDVTASDITGQAGIAFATGPGVFINPVDLLTFTGDLVLASKVLGNLNVDRWTNGVLVSNDVYDPVTSSTEVQATYDGTTLRIYQDAVLKKSIALAGPLYVAGYAYLQENPATSVTLTGNSTEEEKRYTCNVQLSCGTTHRENVAILLSSCAAKLSRPGGKLRPHVASYEAPTETITDSDVLGAVTFGTHPTDDLNYNAVGGSAFDPTRNWQYLPFPVRTQQTYQDDDGRRSDRLLDLQATIGSFRCQRIAEIALRESRQKFFADFDKLSLRASRIARFQTFTWQSTRLGLSLTMRCEQFKIRTDGFVGMKARVTAESVYEDPAPGDYIDPIVGSLTAAQLETPPEPTSLVLTGFPQWIIATVGGSFPPGTMVSIWELSASGPFSAAAVVSQGINQSVHVIPRRTTGNFYYWATYTFNGQISDEFPDGAGTLGAADQTQTGDVADDAITETYLAEDAGPQEINGATTPESFCALGVTLGPYDYDVDLICNATLQCYHTTGSAAGTVRLRSNDTYSDTVGTTCKVTWDAYQTVTLTYTFTLLAGDTADLDIRASQNGTAGDKLFCQDGVIAVLVRKR